MNVIILPLSQFPKNQYDPYGGLPGTVMQWVETPELGAIVHIANEFVFIPLKRLREYSPKLFEALKR